MSQPYIEYHHGGYWIAGTRVSLDSIVYRWREGLSAETIQKECFPVLSLKQVYGAILFYLENQEEIDAYLIRAEEEEEEIARKISEQYPEIHRRVDEIFQSAQSRKP
ncbi:MAG: DUF433 domain-containing protein [Blastocatellia bacterium]